MNNALPSNSKWIGLGLAVWAVLACSAEASEPPVNGNGNHSSNTGGTGSGGTLSIVPSGGSSAVGSSGSATTAAGQSTTAGGSSPTGTAGTGTAGTAPAGTGGQMGGALSACPSPPAAGAIGDTLIDDLEDKDNGVAKVGGRSGFWYTYVDALGSTITPKPDSTGAAPLLPGTTNCHGGMACIIVSGTTGAADTEAMKYPYAGVGFDFSNAKKPCVYNGSAYSGIKFWARGDVEITIKVNISATADAAGGGTCTTGCSNGHGLKVVLTPDWAQVDVPFATIMQDPTWGTQVPFDKASLLSFQVQFPSGGPFNAALDDLTFY
ncbi:MAG TPA: hypothetical protein VHB79_12205 [Polyangiaceae bacterium]|nr:hypothetical protein [Polyangiaceae bacterium]